MYALQLGILPQNILLLIAILIPLAIWGYVWKFFGLWFSARNGEKAWFIVFALVNLAGILELYYLHSRKYWPFKQNR